MNFLTYNNEPEEALAKVYREYESQIAGILSGFDRLVFCGSLRKITYVFGLQGYLWTQDVLLKNFALMSSRSVNKSSRPLCCGFLA